MAALTANRVEMVESLLLVSRIRQTGSPGNKVGYVLAPKSLLNLAAPGKVSYLSFALSL